MTGGGIVGGNTSMQLMALGSSVFGSGKSSNPAILIPVKESMHTHWFGGGSTHCMEQNVAKPSVSTQQIVGRVSCCMGQFIPKFSGIESVQV